MRIDRAEFAAALARKDLKCKDLESAPGGVADQWAGGKAPDENYGCCEGDGIVQYIPPPWRPGWYHPPHSVRPQG